jgi:hypothetical protein
MIMMSLSTAAIARADEREVHSFAFDASAGWLHTSVFDTRLEMADVRLGFGGSWQTPRGFGVELLGTFGLQLGRTQAGRSLTGGEPFGGELIFHYAWFRFGLGARFGGLQVARSTSDQSDDYAIGDAYGGIGVEPFAIDHSWPMFFDVEAHALAWGGQSMHGFELRAGIRFCGKDCAF